jgi:toxin CcdB
MARFDVCRNQGGNGYLLDVQSDLLGGLNTRVVVPLLPKNDAPRPAERLNPEFEVQRTKVVMATQFMAAIPESELSSSVCNLTSQQHEISVALDMLFLGF